MLHSSLFDNAFMRLDVHVFTHPLQGRKKQERSRINTSKVSRYPTSINETNKAEKPRFISHGKYEYLKIMSDVFTHNFELLVILRTATITRTQWALVTFFINKRLRMEWAGKNLKSKSMPESRSMELVWPRDRVAATASLATDRPLRTNNRSGCTHPCRFSKPHSFHMLLYRHSDFT